ncbi:hypothetical protein [Streptomyces sp. NBC_00847]|uniref:hypothetical protein n=1 Tax=Streptomyces sp. NBC_00847 TaxID=2975850 RepID=UPI002259F813|nr:hypothetical protein [Streptomyces sp. NBC_00847]MCX4882786.1 hypothetical protein [Streptomyces sp. NBC_00847]
MVEMPMERSTVTDFEFDLTPTMTCDIQGFRGRIGPFGEVDVRSVLATGTTQHNQTVLKGEKFPEAVFSGGGTGGVPSLDGGWLQVDGISVRIDLRVKGVRKGSRWLDIWYLDRQYTYRSAGQGKEAVLSRGSVSVTIDRAVGKPGVERVGKAVGGADGTDLAIAIVFEQVDTACLTLSGALLAIPRNFLLGNGRDEG